MSKRAAVDRVEGGSQRGGPASASERAESGERRAASRGRGGSKSKSKSVASILSHQQSDWTGRPVAARQQGELNLLTGRLELEMKSPKR